MNKSNRRDSLLSEIRNQKEDNYKTIFQNCSIALLLMDGSSVGKVFKGETSSDEHERILKEKSAQKRHKSMKKILEQLKILEMNQAAVDLFETKTTQELKSHFMKALPQKSVHTLFDALGILAQDVDFIEKEIQINTFKGNRYHCLLRVSVPQDSDRALKKLIVSLQDITARRKMEDYLRKMAQLDGLTRLFNHYAINERLKEELDRAKRYGSDLSCIMIDVDHFKLINDQFGHQKGDQILRQVAWLIKDNLRKSDMVGRYGGDEFFIILPETRFQNALVPAQRIQLAFKKKMEQYRSNLGIVNSLSIGISSYPSKGINDYKDLIAIADKAMYQAKSTGRE